MAGENMQTPRQRLTETLNHRQPDRLCVDFGAGGQTGMGVLAVHRLRQELLPDPAHRVKVIEPYQMLGELDPEMIRALELDITGIHGPGTMFGFPLGDWKPFCMHGGTEVLVPGRFNFTYDEKGAVIMYPGGDISLPPSASMPKESYFFDALPREAGMLDLPDLDPADNCEEFGPVTDEDLEYWDREITYLYGQTDLGIYFTIPGTGFGDIALVPATWMAYPKGIRDIQEWYMALVARPDYVKAVFEKQCEYALKNIEMLAPVLKDRVQVAFISGTDFGMQSGLFVPVESYRDLFKPFHTAVNRKIHELTGCKTFIHSCGAVFDLVPEFIEAGFDILNPVQISATGMSPAGLKQEFGNDIVFWGGGIDTQKTLPFGTPDEVYREARKNIEIFGEGGGFVFNSVHNVQSNVPLENILAMLRAVNDARGIPWPPNR
jgi:hypothetical protein